MNYPNSNGCENGLPRRRFLLSGLVALLAGLGVPAGLRAQDRRGVTGRTAAAGPVRNVVLFIADGVGTAHYALARAYKGAPLVFESAICGLAATASADSFITDSAAAGTAIATGYRTRNGSVGVDADGRERRTILEAARTSGRATGLVVTGSFTTATAAVFAAHTKARGETLQIARQLVEADLTVMLGGGRKLLDKPLVEGERLTMEQALRERGYALPTTAAELEATAAGRVFGLFAEDAFFPVIDRAKLGPTQPMLPAMTRHALQTLDQNEKGFFVMVEGTQTDWAGHQNDPVMLVHELLEFDAAVAVAMRFAAGRSDTLVIVVSDHACGGLTLGNSRAQAASKRSLSQDELLAPLRAAKASATALWEAYGIAQKPEAETIRRVVAEHWGVQFSEAQVAEVLAAAVDPKRDEDYDGLGRVFSRDFTYLDWTTHEHTAEDVPLYAMGPGAPGGAMHLTELAGVMARALGVTLD